MARRYLAQRLPSGEWLGELPLADESITRSLSAPGRLGGVLPVETRHLIGADGLPLLTEWGTAIWSEVDGVIRGGGILTSVTVDGESLGVECTGFTGYPAGQPWLDDPQSFLLHDPLDLLRLIWTRLQAYPSGDLGVTVDPLTTTVRLGPLGFWTNEATGATEPESVGWDTETTRDGWKFTPAAPFRLSWWETPDLGAVHADLITAAQVEYLEQITWNADRTAVTQHLRLGSPIGARRPDLRFEIGVNVTAPPPLDLADYASDVIVLGAGSGEAQLRAAATRDTGRLRRVVVVPAKDLTRQEQLTARAHEEIVRRTARVTTTTVTILEHPNAPLGQITPGDSIHLTGDAGWAQFDHWARIHSITEYGNDTATVEVVPE